MALTLKYLTCPFCSTFMACLFTTPSFNTPLYLKFPLSTSPSGKHLLIVQPSLIITSSVKPFSIRPCKCTDTAPVSKKHHMHISISALIAILCDAYLPVRAPQFLPYRCWIFSLSPIDVEFPTQAMLHKPGVSDILVSCCWLLNEAVILFYHDILTKENETF